jgi:hypothetical protein
LGQVPLGHQAGPGRDLQQDEEAGQPCQPSASADLVTIPPKSALSLPVDATPLDTTLSGNPRDWAISSEVTLLNPNWNWPLTTPGTIAAPPWPLSRVSSMLRPVKNHFSLPR